MNSYVPFKKDEFLQAGQEYFTHIPDYAKEQYSRFQVVELIDEIGHKKLTVEMLEAASGAAIKALRFTCEYIEDGEEARFNFDADYTAAKKAVNIVTKTVLQQFSKRFALLAEDPENHFRELEFISFLAYEKSYEYDFHKIPYAIIAAHPIQADCELLITAANTLQFIRKIMPKVKLPETGENDLVPNQELTMAMNNLKMEFKSGPQSIEEEVYFQIVNHGDKIHLVSKPGVNNLHQIGFSIEFEKEGEGITKMQLGFHYSASKLLSVGSKLLGFANYFVSTPDLSKLSFLHAKTLFNTFCRHVVAGLSESLNENLFEMKNPIGQLQRKNSF